MIPDFFKELLVKQYGIEVANKIVEGLSKEKYVTIRVNTIKTSPEEIKEELDIEGIKHKDVEWYKDALIIENVKEDKIRELEMYKNGKIYMQNLSSMIPVIILEPKEKENILDMASAPGGKTTQISAMSNNESIITACESNKIRVERLKYNIQKQGAQRIGVMKEDARNLSDYFSFDNILLDAPCSGSGTENVFKENFRKELINKTVRLQEQLLSKALKILKQGKTMVYSTCSILDKENEEILKKILPKFNAKIEKIDKEKFKGINFLDTELDGTLCIEPNEFYEGFFVAKIRKM